MSGYCNLWSYRLRLKYGYLAGGFPSGPPPLHVELDSDDDRFHVVRLPLSRASRASFRHGRRTPAVQLEQDGPLLVPLSFNSYLQSVRYHRRRTQKRKQRPRCTCFFLLEASLTARPWNKVEKKNLKLIPYNYPGLLRTHFISLWPLGILPTWQLSSPSTTAT